MDNLQQRSINRKVLSLLTTLSLTLIAIFFIFSFVLVRENHVSFHKEISKKTITTLVGNSEKTIRQKDFHSLASKLWKTGLFKNVFVLDSNCNVITQRIINQEKTISCDYEDQILELHYPTLGIYYIAWVPAYDDFIKKKMVLFLVLFGIILLFISYLLTKWLSKYFINNFEELTNSILENDKKKPIPVELQKLANIIQKSYKIKAQKARLEQKAEETLRKERLLTKISHDIKSPLAVLQSLQIETTDEKKHLFNLAIQRLLGLAESLLKNKNTVKRKKSTDVNELVFNIASQKKIEYKDIKEEVEITYSLLGEKILIPVDNIELGAILSNIINNSIEAGLSRKISPMLINLMLKKHDGEYILNIEDNCGGIDPAFLSDIFKYGATTKDTGNGIGLYHAQEYLRRSGGEITFNQSKVGISFSLKLPSNKKND